ncbi:hypothetical protein MBLNU459_g1270t1 [Dothideomycetes sp. NU459]
MAPYNSGQYGTRYDPVGSQYNQQQGYHYSHSLPQSATSHNQESVTSSMYQAPVYPSTFSGNSYNGTTSWSQATAQPDNTTVSRAAETLSHLSAQEHSQALPSSARGSNAQYDTSGWGNPAYHSTSESNAPASRSAGRPANNTSPTYSTQTNRPVTNVSGHGAAQLFAQQAAPASTRPYGSMSHTPAADPLRAGASHTPTNSHPYPAPSTQPSTAQQSYQPKSPYSNPRQRKAGTEKTDSTARRPSNGGTMSMQSSARDQYQLTSRSANTGQPRAPSVTPSTVQQHTGSQYARQGAPAEPLAPTTVDPSQVYDPWPEQERRMKIVEKKRRVEAAAQAQKKEEEREAEEAKQKRIEDEKEKQRQELVEEYTQDHAHRQTSAHQPATRVGPSRTQPTQPFAPPRLPPTQPGEPAIDAAGKSSDELEAEMLLMFQKMREYNARNPSLLARLWEQERQSHLAKTQSPAPSAPAPAPPVSGAPVQVDSTRTRSTQLTAPTTTQGSNSQAKPSAVSGPSTNTSTVHAKVTPKPRFGSAAAQAGPASAIWPPGKKTHLAEAAAKWLNARPENADKQVTASRIVNLLDGNPSYLTLCETLEGIELAMDRAAFARALLASVPDMNKSNATQPNAANQPMVMTQLADPIGSSGVHLEPPPSTTKSGKNKSANAGKYPGQRGRPKKDGTETQSTSKTSGTAQPWMTGQPSEQRDTVDLSRPAPEIGFPQPTSMTGMHSGALHDQPRQQDIVAYQSDFRLDAPVDGVVEYSMPVGPTSQLHQRPLFATANSGTQPIGNYQSPNLGKAVSKVQTQQSSQRAAPPLSRNPPASKEEAARKRTFADLVDLTAEQDSDEDLQPAVKYPNTQQHPVADANASSAMMSLAQQPGLPLFEQYTHYGPPQNNSIAASASAPLPPASHLAQPAPAPVPHILDDLRNKTLVQPIEREKVARKSRYDPRTICRDVLLATGRHPEMDALNQHLFDMHGLLKGHSANVEADKFDLATIRWDLIDPGDPLPETGDEQDADADDEEDGQENGTTEAPASKTGQGGQVNKLFGRKKGKVGRPPRSAYRPAGQSASGGETSANATPNPSKYNDNTSAIAAPRAVITPRLGSKFTTVNMTPGSGAVGYAAFRATSATMDEDGKPVKKKGRPVGWRKDIHSKAAVAAANGGTPPPTVTMARGKPGPMTSYNQVPRRRGRPPTKNLNDPDITFNVYKCQWEDCGAELHNIDTLRKHMIKLHGKKSSGDEFECLWRGCFRAKEGGGGDEMYAFDAMEPWIEHVERTHMMPVARTLGDGPRAGLSDHLDSETSEAYLSDRSGRIVTPRISVPETRQQGTPEHMAAQRRVADAKRLSELQGARLQGEKLLQQLEEKKRVVGPGLDRAGCTLATTERRKGLYDDEDFEDVIEADEIEWQGAD